MKDIFVRSCVAILFILVFLAGIYLTQTSTHTISQDHKGETKQDSLNPMSITYQKEKKYPGSNFVIEEELTKTDNYKQYLASYKSDGLKIFGLLTVPISEQPKNGFPAIIFNHGYIPPEEYRTTERYVAYLDGFAGNGFVVFKPDYRGHDKSEGNPSGAYFSPDYTADVLNAVASVKKLPYVNKNKIGMWGHSLGGYLTLRAMVIDPTIKVGIIWGGVVGSYKDLSDEWWSKRKNFTPFTPSQREQNSNRPSRQKFIDLYGQPSEKSTFWNSISATSYLETLTAPIQLHHGLSDATVPYSLSQKLYDRLIKIGKTAELYLYTDADHNLSQAFNLAEQRSIDFFSKYLKN